MKPSKAPWTRHEVAVHDANDRLVAMCFGGTPGEAEENAQLASAAPEILEALESMVDMVEMNGFIRDYAMEIARNAIKKARGEE